MGMELSKVERLILKVFGKTTSQKYPAYKLELKSRGFKNKSKITKILKKVSNNQNQSYRLNNQNNKNCNHKINLSKKQMKRRLKASKFQINSQKVRKIKEKSKKMRIIRMKMSQKTND